MSTVKEKKLAMKEHREFFTHVTEKDKSTNYAYTMCTVFPGFGRDLGKQILRCQSRDADGSVGAEATWKGSRSFFKSVVKKIQKLDTVV